MIAAGLNWEGSSRFDLSRLCISLGMLSGGSADEEAWDGGSIAVLGAPRIVRHARRSFVAARTPSGRRVAISGWIDNAPAIARELGLSQESDPATIYGAAVEAWGDEAERHLIGDYASIVVTGPSSMRLARAPWSRQSLFWASADGATVAASIPRPLFAAGFAKRGDPDQYVLAISRVGALQGEQHFFAGVRRVPQGAVVEIDHHRHETRQWYDPHALRPTRLRRDEDYVDAANALLSEAVAAAIRPARRPGILLSGGLDSPIVADEMLRQLPADATLPSFTFVPLPGDHGQSPPAMFDSDRPAVEAFARMHPRLRPQFVANEGFAFQNRMQDFFVAADAAYPSVAITDADGARQAAADAGIDWLYTADFGNHTFSNDGRWGFVEFLRQGRWIELWRMLRDHPGDDRTMLRRLVARSLLPNLPATVRGALRTLVHGQPAPSLLRPEIEERLRLQERYNAVFGDREWTRSRYESNEMTWQQCGGGGEMVHAVEQIHGLRVRAVPQYRPLFEFCLTIPTGQYVRHGQMRWLARRMAVGRMPEAQRLNTDYGRHGVDWHRRNAPHVPFLREELVRIADDPLMSRIIDVDRAIDRIDQWPEQPSRKAYEEIFMPVAAAVVAGRFARYVDGRN